MSYYCLTEGRGSAWKRIWAGVYAKRLVWACKDIDETAVIPFLALRHCLSLRGWLLLYRINFFWHIQKTTEKLLIFLLLMYVEGPYARSDCLITYPPKNRIADSICPQPTFWAALYVLVSPFYKPSYDRSLPSPRLAPIFFYPGCSVAPGGKRWLHILATADLTLLVSSTPGNLMPAWPHQHHVRISSLASQNTGFIRIPRVAVRYTALAGTKRPVSSVAEVCGCCRVAGLKLLGSPINGVFRLRCQRSANRTHHQCCGKHSAIPDVHSHIFFLLPINTSQICFCPRLAKQTH